MNTTNATLHNVEIQVMISELQFSNTLNQYLLCLVNQ